jgi:Flp pilus assembly protein TadG
VAGLLVFFIYGIVCFGLILSQKNSITQAAAEGARSSLSVPGIALPTDLQRTDYAKATVARTLSWMGAKYQAGDTTAVIAGCSSPTDTARCITVTITYPYSSRPLIPAAPLISMITPNTVHATAVVRVS